MPVSFICPRVFLDGDLASACRNFWIWHGVTHISHDHYHIEPPRPTRVWSSNRSSSCVFVQRFTFNAIYPRNTLAIIFNTNIITVINCCHGVLTTTTTTINNQTTVTITSSSFVINNTGTAVITHWGVIRALTGERVTNGTLVRLPAPDVSRET